MTLRVRPEAVADIVDAARWYETHGVGLGVSFVEEVHAAFERIEAGPLRYAVVHASFRRAFVRRFPFSVFISICKTRISSSWQCCTSGEPRPFWAAGPRRTTGTERLNICKVYPAGRHHEIIVKPSQFCAA